LSSPACAKSYKQLLTAEINFAHFIQIGVVKSELGIGREAKPPEFCDMNVNF